MQEKARHCMCNESLFSNFPWSPLARPKGRGVIEWQCRHSNIEKPSHQMCSTRWKLSNKWGGYKGNHSIKSEQVLLYECLQIRGHYSIMFKSETQLDSKPSIDNYQSWEIGQDTYPFWASLFSSNKIGWIVFTVLGSCEVNKIICMKLFVQLPGT